MISLILPSNSNFTSFFIRFWSTLICLSIARLILEEPDELSMTDAGLLLKFPILYNVERKNWGK